ncbi:MAG: C40 family peptidase [Actinomycetota bacterium]
MWLSRRIHGLLVACLILGTALGAPSAATAGGPLESVAARTKLAGVPDWAKPAVRYLIAGDMLGKERIRPNQAVTRAEFTMMMKKAFGGGYSKSRGNVTAGEVSAALVRKLGRKPLARRLAHAKSPNGWDPDLGGRFGTEVVARELGLRHDRPTSEERKEAASDDPMSLADVAWALWKAKTAPNTYAADALADFSLANYQGVRRDVVAFALSLAGSPYVWAGEWPQRTPDGYPYGAQPSGGFDCSGFIWYVLQKKSAAYSPRGRTYAGWSLPQRSSADMAAAVRPKKRLRYREFKPGDIVLFAPGGRDSKASSVYHAGLYMGRGWIVHSSGSRAGVSLAEIGPGSWWHSQIFAGRRIIR